MSSLQFGLFSMNTGPCTYPESMVRIARAAEATGFDSLWAPEHYVLPSNPSPTLQVDPTERMLDPLETLSYLAGFDRAYLARFRCRRSSAPQPGRARQAHRDAAGALGQSLHLWSRRWAPRAGVRGAWNVAGRAWTVGRRDPGCDGLALVRRRSGDEGRSISSSAASRPTHGRKVFRSW